MLKSKVLPQQFSPQTNVDIKEQCLYARCKPNPKDLQPLLTLGDDITAARLSAVDTLCSTLIPTESVSTRTKSVS